MPWSPQHSLTEALFQAMQPRRVAASPLSSESTAMVSPWEGKATTVHHPTSPSSSRYKAQFQTRAAGTSRVLFFHPSLTWGMEALTMGWWAESAGPCALSPQLIDREEVSLWDMQVEKSRGHLPLPTIKKQITQLKKNKQSIWVDISPNMIY